MVFQLKQVNHSFIDKIIYINLDFRIDRQASIERQLSVFPKDKCIRLSAIHNKKGYIGCAQSHIKAIEQAIENNYENVLVIEDDMLWHNLEQNYCIFEYLTRTKEFDAIVLGGSAPIYDKDTLRMYAASSTIAYFVKRHYFTTLLTNLKSGVDLLQTFYHSPSFALDQYWKRIQVTGKWFIVRPSLCYQAFNLSDTENMLFDNTHYYINKPISPAEPNIPKSLSEFLDQPNMNLVIRLHGSLQTNTQFVLQDSFTRYIQCNIESAQHDEFNSMIMTLQMCITDCFYFDFILDSQVVSFFIPLLFKTHYILFLKGSDFSSLLAIGWTIYTSFDSIDILRNPFFPI